jgi:hypothetical protein
MTGRRWLCNSSPGFEFLGVNVMVDFHKKNMQVIDEVLYEFLKTIIIMIFL